MGQEVDKVPRMLVAALLIAAVAACGCAATRFETASAQVGCINERISSEDTEIFSEEPGCREEESCDKVFVMLPVFDAEPKSWRGRDMVRDSSHPEIHGPYSVSLVGDFIAPSWKKLDEAYGMDSRFLIRAVDDFYIGCTLGYARVKNELTKGLIEGELLRYTALLWSEYRLRLGKTTWSPSVDFCLGTGWFVAEPVPLSEEKKAYELAGQKLRTDVISALVLRMAAQLRLPMLRSTDMSISEGNADIVIGIGAEFGEGKSRYKIVDYSAGTKVISKGHVLLDAFHAFVGLSFRF